jgi:hypothetical protein
VVRLADIDIQTNMRDKEVQDIVMEQQKFLQELAALPPEGRRQVERLVRLLKKRYARSSSRGKAKRSPLRDEKFVGMWKDREDLKDSSAWVRSIRKSEWMN